MGCVSSKKARSESPAASAAFDEGPRHGSVLSLHDSIDAALRDESSVKEDDYDDNESGIRGAVEREVSTTNAAPLSIQFERMAEAELAAAGWPPWMTAVAGDAIHGWLPLRADAYERLDKIGQGTYSNVYRARDLKTGNTVAVKKVRFDNFQPESVRFMAREILILRKLNHPNVMKLQGIITSRLSCTIYLVFDYMEHDLAGLLSCPQVKFTDSQIKCLMKQLLSGLGHCHSRGIMHRDIKCSNILVNNEGVLKIADFGLAYFTNKQPLTSRVVTLWYRPPELLLGSTTYSETVDLWSVGCVFAELFIGRPILKGHNEVEQLHKIFKLCGSPADDYWKTSKLPLASMFKPQQPYESTLVERCKEFPKGAVGLIQTLLSVDPIKRGSALSALDCEYFNTKPYACEPSSMPKFPPNKEIDAKARDEARRKISVSVTMRPAMVSKNPRRSRKTLHESSDFCKVIPEEIEPKAPQQLARVAPPQRRKSGAGSHPSLKQPSDTKSDISVASNASQDSITSVRSVPAQMTTSNSFTWAKRPKQDVFTRLYTQPTIREGQETDDRKVAIKKQAKLHRHDSFDSSEIYVSQDLSEDYASKKKRQEALFSGPLVYKHQEKESTNYDRQVPRRSRFHIKD